VTRPVPKDLHALADITAYARRHGGELDDVERSLIDKTRAFGGPAMMLTTPDQARFLALLVTLMGARQILELGTFTGYSALAMARVLPSDGHLVTCDLSRVWTSVACEHWERAGVADRIELRLQVAMIVVESLPAEEQLDLVFIDADKGNYVNYFERVMPRLRPGGLVVADNVLACGRVLSQAEPGSVAEAMDRFNRHVATDIRVDAMILPIGDGLSIIRKLG
jgi:caffeoyl-CoA O-methyltransferase